MRISDCADLPAARILLAEDNPINPELMREMLARLNQSVVIASDGHEAVEAVRRPAVTGDLFDIGLMDMQMPRSAPVLSRTQSFGSRRLHAC